jgi:streptomycin 6-kinase
VGRDLSHAPPPRIDRIRFSRRLALVGEAAAIGRRRLLQWLLAWAGLSAARSLGDGASPAAALAVAERADTALNS